MPPLLPVFRLGAVVAALSALAGCGGAEERERGVQTLRLDDRGREAMIASVKRMTAGMDSSEQQDFILNLWENVRPSSPFKWTESFAYLAGVDNAVYVLERMLNSPGVVALKARHSLAGRTLPEIRAAAYGLREKRLRRMQTRAHGAEERRARAQREQESYQIIKAEAEAAYVRCATAQHELEKVRLLSATFERQGMNNLLVLTVANASRYRIKSMTVNARHMFAGESKPRAQVRFGIGWAPPMKDPLFPEAQRSLYAQLDKRNWEHGLFPGETKQTRSPSQGETFPLANAPADSSVEIGVVQIVAMIDDGDGWGWEWVFEPDEDVALCERQKEIARNANRQLARMAHKDEP
ncbi:MAG: hypothetical protein LBI92_03275 [Azoarcus sp.]|jgi:hypothetical protein|nr:hypothetical protein [Azoarcus sp.]